MTWATVCHYCRSRVFSAMEVQCGADPRRARTHDHVKPKVLGFGNSNNLVTACMACNGIKSDAPYEVFTFFVANHAGYSGSLSDATAFRQFRHDLTIAGFIAAKALIRFRQKERAASSESASPSADEPMSRRRKAAAAEEKKEIAALPLRQASPYTLKSLRRRPSKRGIQGAISAARARDRSIVLEAQRALGEATRTAE